MCIQDVSKGKINQEVKENVYIYICTLIEKIHIFSIEFDYYFTQRHVDIY